MKTKVLMLSKVFPLAMSTYFTRAFQHREDVDIRTVGYYSGTKIPWKRGMNLPTKYAIPPTYPLFNDVPVVYWDYVKGMLGDWQPDLVITVDAGVRFDVKPDLGKVVHVATDPHVILYDKAREICDKFYNMQFCYKYFDDVYLPYAFDQYAHYSEPQEKKYDCALIGMPYPKRDVLVSELRRNGISVVYENGPIFDEYRELNNQAQIGLNYSSMLDMTARVFELMAMGIAPVINRVPDLDLFFVEGKHYLGFDTVSEAVQQVKSLLAKPLEIARIGGSAYANVWQPNYSGYATHSYSARVHTILQDMELI